MMGSQSLDQAARKMGFRDFATYQAYRNNQNAILGAGVTRVKPVTWGGAVQQPGVQPQPAAPPQNWLQHLISALNGGH